MERGDEGENPYEDAERRMAEVRNEERVESERRVAEARNEALNKTRIEMDRRMAEMERRMAAEKERHPCPPAKALAKWPDTLPAKSEPSCSL